ncbi:MAG: FmdE family protein [Infirmifilum uzonense]|uniref:FmdE family protein n=1 Tax=Infirmifilum uzonense TaxID=1550241 RepID=UPI003C759C70
MVSRELVQKAKAFHGHVCPFLVLGLRATEIGFSKLGLRRPGEAETIREDVIAIVEANNCFADGVQVASGCTLGNNSLIYLDTGKNAVTFYRRDTGKGVRIYVHSDKVRELFPSRGSELWRKVVVERKGSKEEAEELAKIWEEIGYKMADLSEEFFKIEEVSLKQVIERAPIFESVRCVSCGELVRADRVFYLDGKPYCAKCAGLDVPAVIGRGIVKSFHVPF